MWQGKLATYSIASVARREGRTDWNEVTQGNKIVLPREVLDYLMRRGLPFDKFQLLNPENGKDGLRLFTGPLDFCAASGECYLPTWVMKQLGLKAGEMCAVATANFPSPNYVKFQPHTSDFLDVSDHYTVLTRTLENMGGLTQGSYVRVTDGQRSYTLDVVEVQGKTMAQGTRDDSNGRAVSIGLLECPVEFEEPKDIQSKKKKKAKQAAAAAAAAAAKAGEADAPGGADQQAAEGEGAAEAEEEAKEAGGRASASRRSGGASAAARRRSAGEAAAASEGAAAGDVSGAAPPAAKPVPKFKRRKEAADAGEAVEDVASPFKGKARSLGGASTKEEAADVDAEDGGGAAAASELAKARAAAKAKQAQEALEREAALAEAEAAAEDAVAAAPQSPVLVVTQKLLALLQALLAALWNLARQLLTPSDVDHA